MKIEQRFRQWIIADMHRTFSRAMHGDGHFNPTDVARTVRARRRAIASAVSMKPDWFAINDGSAAAFQSMKGR